MGISTLRITYTNWFWGKSDRNNPARLHLLEHHLADVGGPSGIMSLHHHRGAFVHPCQHTTTVVH